LSTCSVSSDWVAVLATARRALSPRAERSGSRFLGRAGGEFFLSPLSAFIHSDRRRALRKGPPTSKCSSANRTRSDFGKPGHEAHSFIFASTAPDFFGLDSKASDKRPTQRRWSPSPPIRAMNFWYIKPAFCTIILDSTRFSLKISADFQLRSTIFLPAPASASS